jgi:hypothetical protein
LTIDGSNIERKDELLQVIARLQGISLVQVVSGRGLPDVFYEIPTSKVPVIVKELVETLPGIPTIPEDWKPDPTSTVRLSQLKEAKDALLKRKTELSLAPLLGKQSAETKSDGAQNNSKPGSEVPIAQIIQTNVTRFGTIIMITFLVSILTPLYRYNIRLATYYDARADVIGLFGTKLKSVGFLQLSAALTPSFDFGKTPSTPVEQIIELVRGHGEEEIKRYRISFSTPGSICCLPPIPFRLPPHRRSLRVLELEPIRRSARSIARAQPLRDDAL